MALLVGAGPDRWWPGPVGLYAGGALGVVYITVAAWAVRGLGVLRLALSTVAGQLAGGLLIDLISPGRAGGVDAATVAGVVLTLAGVALAGRAAPPAPGPVRRPAPPPDPAVPGPARGPAPEPLARSDPAPGTMDP